ncbi:hypothetical protein BaRGS_00034618 [Batillaria attramentaria]|uniref:SWIM-type domain-containing protein n=1 Tax=Batillaria attramentaria TaxID=370345 RepID=A0ABD0JGU2_9CAEN
MLSFARRKPHNCETYSLRYLFVSFILLLIELAQQTGSSIVHVQCGRHTVKPILRQIIGLAGSSQDRYTSSVSSLVVDSGHSCAVHVPRSGRSGNELSFELCRGRRDTVCKHTAMINILASVNDAFKTMVTPVLSTCQGVAALGTSFCLSFG